MLVDLKNGVWDKKKKIAGFLVLNLITRCSLKMRQSILFKTLWTMLDF